jgi:cyclophilin family peptidyl-prolyl cis-trans isomerase/protein-disulfide isomerase
MVARSAALLFALLALAACQPASAPPAPSPTVFRVVVTITPLPTEAVVGAVDRVLGTDDAFLTITAYMDFQCAPCVDLARTLLVLRSRYPDDLKLVFRHFVQADNDKSLMAAQAAEAAGDQGLFWPMHDLLFAEQAQWRSFQPAEFRAKLSEYAQRLNLPDAAAFEHSLSSQRYARLIQIAAQQARLLGFSSVPALAFNDQVYSGRIDEYALDGYVRLRLLEKRWFKAAPPLQIDLAKKYRATLVTEKGKIVIELFPQQAPVAVNNFVFLARQGWYDQNTFHIVKRDFAAETGDPSGTGFGSAGYRLIDEFDNGLKFDKPGVVAMANAIQQDRPNTASSRFFITFRALEPTDQYNGRYTIFGQVIQGIEVLESLTPRNPFDLTISPNPPPGDSLVTVKITELAEG